MLWYQYGFSLATVAAVFSFLFLFCNLVLHRFTCSLNAFAHRDVTKATMHNLLIHNLHFSFSLHSFWLAFFHIVSFVFCCISLFTTTFVWRIEFEILKFNRCEKNTVFFLNWNENATVFNRYNKIDFSFSIFLFSFFCSQMKQVQKIKFKKIEENSTPLCFTLHKQISYRLHDEHLFRNHIKVHVTVGWEQVKGKKYLPSFGIWNVIEEKTSVSRV